MRVQITTWWWDLPVDPEHSEVIRLKGVVDTKPLVAIVDDDPSLCRALKRLVLSLGVHAETFSSGEAFLEHLQALPSRAANCVILDVQMPGLSGLEVLERLRALRLSLPVIVITAHETANTREAALAAGAVAFLRKPFDDRALVSALETALDGRDAMRASK